MTIRYLLLSTLLVLIVAVAASAARTGNAPRAGYEDVIERSFTVSPGQTLQLTSDLGSVRVVGGGGNQAVVRIVKKVEGGSQSRAEDLLQRFEVTFGQTGGGLHIKGDFDRPLRGRNGLRVAYEIRIPRDFEVNLSTSGGSINVETLQGNARLNTSGGSISVKDIQGTVDAETSGGSVSAENIGGNATLETSGGGIKLSNISGAAKAHTSGGGITAERVGGGLTGGTSGGSINLSEIRGAVQASTSGGSIVARLAGQPGPVRLSTSGGGITVHLDPGARMNVEASSSGGGVSSAFAVAGRLEKNSIRGTINGGGPLLSVETSGGGVSIRER